MTLSRSVLRVACLLGLSGAAWLAPAADLQYFSPVGSKAPYSAAVRAGDTVYVSGQLGVGADGKLPEDFDTQASNTLANVGAALRGVGLSMDDVAQCTVMIVDMRHWAAFNRIYSAAFKPDKLPARSAMAVTALPLNAALEVDCKAYAGNA